MMGLGEEDGPWSSGWAERCGCNTTPFRGAVSHKDYVGSHGVRGCIVDIGWKEELKEVEPYYDSTLCTEIQRNLDLLFVQQNAVIRRLKEMEELLIRIMQK